MKHTKKLFAIALTLIMALALTVPAFAATITITPPTIPSADTDTDNEAYAAYKIFDATFEGETLAADAKISYTINSETNPFYATIAAKTEWFELTQVNGSAIYVVEPTAAYTTEKAIELGDLLKGVVDDAAEAGTPIAPAATGTKSGENFQLDVGAKGYYFITSTLGSDIIVDTLDNITIQSKNEYPSLAKEADKEEASFGETITYTLTITIPDSVDKEIVVTDTMEAGLTFVEFTSAEEANVTAVNNGQVNTITIGSAKAGSTVVVTYTAYINTESGEIYENLNTNTAYLTYSEYKSTDVVVNVASYEATFKKIDGLTKVALEGVTFQLTDADGNEIALVAGENSVYRVADAEVESAVISTNAEGVFTIQGLGNGTYKLVELSTLAGYNLLEAPVEFEIEDANNYFGGLDTETEEDDNNIIINMSGTQLPSTGGIGTTIFYVVGGLLMAGAGILLVTKKRMADEE